MTIYERIEVIELNKVFSIIAAVSIVLTSIFITFLLLLIPLTAKADGILPADYPDAALINEGSNYMGTLQQARDTVISHNIN